MSTRVLHTQKRSSSMVPAIGIVGVVFSILVAIYVSSFALLISSLFGTMMVTLGAWGALKSRSLIRTAERIQSLQLGPEWSFYLSVRLPQKWGQVDAILVGPTGIFVITFLSLAGIVTEKNGILYQNGFEVSSVSTTKMKKWCVSLSTLLQKSLHEKVQVVPVLVNTNPFGMTLMGYAKKDGEVTLLPQRDFASFIHAKMYPLPHSLEDAKKIFLDLSLS